MYFSQIHGGDIKSADDVIFMYHYMKNFMFWKGEKSKVNHFKRIPKILLTSILCFCMISSSVLPAIQADELTPADQPTCEESAHTDTRGETSDVTQNTENVTEEAKGENVSSAEEITEATEGKFPAGEPTTEAVAPAEGEITTENAEPTEVAEEEPTFADETAEENKQSDVNETAMPDTAAEPIYVAQIGNKKYETLDGAVKEASDGEVIELLTSCTTEAGLNLSKSLTIQAAAGLESKPVVTFTKYGIALWSKSVTFKDCDVIMNGVGSTPYYQEWNWMTICGQAGSVLNLINVDMTMDGNGLNKHAVYADNGLRLYMEKSNLVIKNYGQDALEWNGGSFDYNVEMVDSTYLSDHNRSGFTGTFHVRTSNSRVDVLNSTGNGSNGSNFYFTDSVVNFNNNGAHGLSANKLESVNSPITANSNGRWGIVANRAKFENCKGDCRIQGNNNGYEGLRVAYAKSFASSPSTFDAINTDMEFLNNGYWKPDDIWSGVTMKNVIANIDGNSTLTIKGSPNTGLRVQGNNSVVTIAEGADVTIMENNSGYIGGGGQGIGGGVRVEPHCKLVLPSNAKIYNNHAELAGDDIYCAEGAVISFGMVGSDWALDNSQNKYRPDAVRCADKIDGWYYDSQDSYWNAHNKPIYVESFSSAEFENGMTTVAGPLALKAAHGVSPIDPADPTRPDAPVWEISKSKVASNLDENFRSKVTLSLPAAETELVSDIVFVLDESSCSAPVKEAVSKMLAELYEQVRDTNAVINIGAIQFRGEVTEFPLSKLTAETADKLNEFMGKRPATGGSNMSMGLLAGEKMLDHSNTPRERKYLILVSDGITYIWDNEETEEQENIGVNFSNADTPDKPFLAGPDGWDVKYGQKFVPTDWDNHFDMRLIDKTIAEKSSIYVRGTDISGAPFLKPDEQMQYASTVDIALYKSMLAYDRIAAKYHANIVLSGVENEMAVYPYGPAFMNYLANGKTVSFEQIQKEVFYLLDAGSKVVDVIGYGVDDKGNDYNMNFLPDSSAMTLTVGGQALDVTEIEVIDSGFNGSAFETSCFGFGSHENANFDFVLHYYRNGLDGNSDECFVWDINIPVSNFAPVQLTYTVELTNPQTVVGTYGEYDADGSERLTGLYTNEEAILYPVDSNGAQGLPELFAKPTVSYKVSEPVDPDKPVDPTDPIDPTEPAAPTVPVDPDKPVDPTVPVDPNHPATGDGFHLFLYLVLMCTSAVILLGLCIRRKENC